MARKSQSDGGQGLVVVDVGGIQQWITAGATELKVLRGGSLMLDQGFADGLAFVEELLGQPADPVGAEWPTEGRWSVPVASSGSMTLLFGAGEDATRVVHSLRSHFASRLPGLAVHVGYVTGKRLNEGASKRLNEGASGELGTEGPSVFQVAVARARRSSRRQSVPAPTPPSHVWGTLPCTACGLASANRSGNRLPARDGQQPRLVCAACQQRIGLSFEDAPVPGTHVAREFQVIGRATESARYRGYMGVICADGNAIGRRFLSKRTPAAIAEESQAVAQDIDVAIRAGLEAAVRSRKDGATVPYNPVIMAGDDVCLVVPADLALTVAAATCTKTPRLPMSAGVLVCHDSLPFSTAHEVAEDLLVGAKRAGRAARGESDPVPHVAFAVESGAGPTVGGDRRMTCSPYPAEVIPDLMAAAREARLGASQAKTLMDALGEGGRVAEREWLLCYHGRGGDAAGGQARQSKLNILFERLGGDAASSPWVGDPHRTPVRDLVTLEGLLS